jgi:hypothetical protein
MPVVEVRDFVKTFSLKRKEAGLRRYESGSAINVNV